jgi:pimeloyl-ACP methyl ester carboxylesterase
MKLYFRKSGKGDPLIILHGLYGSSDNWYSVARELEASHTVYCLDQRNHGRSPHHPHHTYQDLSDDLDDFLYDQQIEKTSIIGHSMGGKTALSFGLRHPEKIDRMVVVDISPRPYDNIQHAKEKAMHERIIHALLAVPVERLTTRQEADQQLQADVPSFDVRQFLLKNLKRNPEGKFFWTLNLDALSKNLNHIFAGVSGWDEPGEYLRNPFPLLFIKGGNSPYIQEEDEHMIRKHLPEARIQTISDSGHWVHVEQPERFMGMVMQFLNAPLP